MRTRISSRGQIVIPAKFRRQDAVVAGQEFEIERIQAGEYVLKRVVFRRNAGLVEHLLACPVKGWYQPFARQETTDDLSMPELG